MRLTWQLAATVLVLAGVVPLLTAAATKVSAPAWVKNLISGGTAALGAVIAYVADVEGVVDWTDVLITAATAWGLAGGMRASTVIGSVEQKINETTGDVGLGPSIPAGVENRAA
jgi:hypothetical protein